jgi:hypothetical protein
MSTDDELFTPEEVLGDFSAKRARLLLFQIESRTCIGYMVHPFVKEATWAFTTLLFIYVMWYSAIDGAGKCFSCTRKNAKNTRFFAAYTQASHAKAA